MTKIKDILEYTETFAPLGTAAGFDNSGLLVGNSQTEVTRVLVCLDITSEVVNEAKNMGAELIISHHPVIFNPIKSIDTTDIPYLLVQAGISALCLHTNLDIAEDSGVNICLSAALGLQNTVVYPEKFVAVGTLDEKMSVEEFALLVKESLGAYSVSYTKGSAPIRTVAMCSGAGGDMYDCAVTLGADVFLTGEAKHHEYIHAAEKGIPLVVAGHFHTEDVFALPLIRKLSDKFPEVSFTKSEKCGCPYLCV